MKIIEIGRKDTAAIPAGDGVVGRSAVSEVFVLFFENIHLIHPVSYILTVTVLFLHKQYYEHYRRDEPCYDDS